MYIPVYNTIFDDIGILINMSRIKCKLVQTQGYFGTWVCGSSPPPTKFQGFLFEGGGFSPPTNPDVISYAHIFFREGGFVMFWGTPPPPGPQNTPANWKTFSSVNMFVDYR
jgi:hypothetical protein